MGDHALLILLKTTSKIHNDAER